MGKGGDAQSPVRISGQIEQTWVKGGDAQRAVRTSGHFEQTWVREAMQTCCALKAGMRNIQKEKRYENADPKAVMAPRQCIYLHHPVYIVGHPYWCDCSAHDVIPYRSGLSASEGSKLRQDQHMGCMLGACTISNR